MIDMTAKAEMFLDLMTGQTEEAGVPFLAQPFVRRVDTLNPVSSKKKILEWLTLSLSHQVAYLNEK